MKLFIILLTATSIILQAQQIEVGVKTSVTLTDQIKYAPDKSVPVSIGGTIEIKLPANFAIEADLLYKRLRSNSSYNLFPEGPYISNTKGESLDLPVIGKYYFRPTRGWRPFLGTGWALRRTWQETEIRQNNGRDLFSRPSEIGIGAVVSAGARYEYRRVKLAPELRYTRWGAGNDFPRRNPNQLELLFGISF
jgi:outer membrane protein W